MTEHNILYFTEFVSQRKKLMTEYNILYFTELKFQRTLKRERGGGVYVFLGLFS